MRGCDERLGELEPRCARRAAQREARFTGTRRPLAGAEEKEVGRERLQLESAWRRGRRGQRRASLYDLNFSGCLGKITQKGKHANNLK